MVFFDFSLTVKAAPRECVIRTGLPYTQVKAENEALFYSKITVSSCTITWTSVYTHNTLFSP